ncbi:helix-turn-helix domain-containing protein [Paenibacillus vulneris]|uniref:Helix-turn-helix domain-containing protein n=1 Tax=Paenibacillus vulneris TaxID=1133364 RepID=A0ABW3URB3_9BACL
MSKSKYFFKLFMFSLFLGTVPVITLGLFSFYQSRASIEEKVEASNMQILQETQMRVEQVLNTLDATITQFVNTPMVRSSLDLPLHQEYFSVYDQLLESMHHLQSLELGVRDVYLINAQQRWVISNQLMSSIEQVDQIGEVMKYFDVPKNAFWINEFSTELEQSGSSVANKSINLSGINLVKKLPINSLNSKELLIANIPYAQLNKLINTNKSLGEVVVLDPNGTVIAHSNIDMIGKNFPALLPDNHFNSIKGHDTGYILTSINHTKIGVSYRKSDMNGWIYVSIIPINQISEASTSIGIFTLLICISIWVITLAISFQGSRKMYSPIKSLYKEALTAKTELKEEVQAKDEFQFIGNQMHFLRELQERLENQLVEQKNMLQEHFVLKLLLDGTSRSEVNEKMQFLWPSLKWQGMSVFTIQIDTLDGTRFQRENYELLLFAISNITGELLPKDRRLNPIIMQQSIVLVVGNNNNSDEEFRHKLYCDAMSIQKAINEYLQLKISIGISRIYQTLTETPRAYQESLEALRYRIRLGHETVLFIDNVLPRQNQHFGFPIKIESDLIDALKMSDVEKAHDLLDQFLKSVLTVNISFRESQIALVRLLSDLIQTLQEAGEESLPFTDSHKSIFDQLFDLHTGQEIEEWFRGQIIKPIIICLEKQRGLHHQKISQMLKNIVHEQFESDLTLEICASKLNYHPNYIRQVFRKEVGMNFSDYLAQHRLKIAKKWLIETDMKIFEISEKLKYNNPQNFIRYFRNMEGITPGQFRSNLGNYHSKSP